ncbi:MAG: cupin domain-containing protein [Desulfovibrionaceae bacterium]|nr:cupin domain-containing protein [Desulfovibrionaceae bacterium]
MCPSLPGISFAAETGKSQTIVRCGEQPSVQGSEKFFTGRARITPLYPAANGMRSSGGSVTFEPGARSNWHVHPVGQVLIVTDGVGRTQEWGGPVREIRAGDVIICPAGVKHWHGASPATAMTHISVCEENEPGRVVDWMEAVTDEQYAGK